MTGAERIEREFTPVHGAPRKEVFVRQGDGRYRRTVYEHNGCTYQITGSEVVEAVTITESLGVAVDG